MYVHNSANSVLAIAGIPLSFERTSPSFWVGLCNSRVIVIWRRRGLEFFAWDSRGGRAALSRFEDAFHVPLLMPRENRETDLADRNDVFPLENLRLRLARRQLTRCLRCRRSLGCDSPSLAPMKLFQTISFIANREEKLVETALNIWQIMDFN